MCLNHFSNLVIDLNDLTSICSDLLRLVNQPFQVINNNHTFSNGANVRYIFMRARFDACVVMRLCDRMRCDAM